ncbi:ISXO2 transposase-like protein [Cereibacter ovatus]|uniref:ISXO2 transposase-like protein n=1 Tax=Cereibacter ovatus TaxID=439529 RepID=A0A285CK17_9RHOB|nr:IS1595 family transposase [Cereibacter ovatus]SNX67378.1 ISXO2 transposase-like protein [Cereibacter ovatus]
MIGVTQKCAWKIGHAIREMMGQANSPATQLAGIVEVDETYVGGAPKYRAGKKNKRGKGTKKQCVLVAVERAGKARAATLPGLKGSDIKPLVDAWIDPETTLMTDGNKAYNKIGACFLDHLSVKHSARNFADPVSGAHINTAEAFSAYVERARVGVYHRLVGIHVQRYLDELAWRWNRRQAAEKVRTDANGKASRHLKWHPIPVVQQMRELFRSAPGKEMRRSANY